MRQLEFVLNSLLVTISQNATSGHPWPPMIHSEVMCIPKRNPPEINIFEILSWKEGRFLVQSPRVFPRVFHFVILYEICVQMFHSLSGIVISNIR